MSVGKTTAFQTSDRPKRWIGAVICCALVAFLDGFDTQTIGPAGSSIAKVLDLPISALGPAFSISQIGFLAGTLAFAPLGDKFGRNRLLVITTSLFAIASLGTAVTFSFNQLLAWRFLAGFGLGGATPNFAGLVADKSPARLRSRMVMLLWAAVPLGGMTGSFLSAAMIPMLGWKSIFLMGGTAPFFLLPFLWMIKTQRMLSAERIPIETLLSRLFGSGALAKTILLWLTSFMTWTVLIVTAFWTPPLLKLAGFSLAQAAQALAFSNIGGVVGTVALAYMLGRIKPPHLLMVTLLAAGLFLGVLGWQAQHGPGSLMGVIIASTAAGFFVSSAGGAVLSLSAEVYAADARATGIGWTLGFGRVGSIVGPLVIGGLVGARLSVEQVYLAISLPALLGAAFVFLLSKRLVPRTASKGLTNESTIAIT